MTQLRRDAAYIRTERHEPTSTAAATQVTAFDEAVYAVLSTAHTVTSATKTLAQSSQPTAVTEDSVAASMQRLLQAERIELSPDS